MAQWVKDMANLAPEFESQVSHGRVELVPVKLSSYSMFELTQKDTHTNKCEIGKKNVYRIVQSEMLCIVLASCR